MSLPSISIIPYPGTPLFDECKENNWLLTEDWSLYDMRGNVMASPLSDAKIKQLTQELYKVFFTPQYAVRKLLSVRSFDDLRFIKKGVAAIAGHMRDFSHRKN